MSIFFTVRSPYRLYCLPFLLTGMYIMLRGILKQHTQGTLHLKFHGSEERQSILAIHDDTQGVIVAEKCVEHDSPWRRAAAEMCDELVSTYHAYDYSLLMNSTFGLVPAGASPGTYRLPEASDNHFFARR